jgi:hypothetical protein
MARRMTTRFPAVWVKVAFALTGSALVLVLLIWLATMWAASIAGG